MDGGNYVTLLLIDKGYYDYDYEKPKKKRGKGKKKQKTEKETSAMLSRFGVATAKRKCKKAAGVSATDVKNMDMERLQAYAMEQAKAARSAK